VSSGKKILANTIDAEEIRVAILDEQGRLYDLFIERMWERQRTGEIYKARVDSVLPGMHAAFVNLGDGRNGFLYLDDVRGIEVKQNGEILVQVVKTARKGKGARVTPRISLAGRYAVLVPGGKDAGVSRRIEDEDERGRLRGMARSVRPKGYGVIVRTVAEGLNEETLGRDVAELMERWEEIERNAKRASAPCLIYRDIGLVERILRDELNDQVEEIIVDNPEEHERIEDFLQHHLSGEAPELSLHRGVTPLFDLYNVEREIEAALDRKVWLSSGAYLVIDQAEALTVIDVNTGKFVGSTDLRDTVLQTNLEAADEIARQLRLRAVGGIVVVDFIDMEVEEDKNRLVARMQELFRTDRCRARVYGVTGLGLVEITRKRARADLRSILSRGCPFCGGTGQVAKEESVAMQIKRFVRKVVGSSRFEAMMIEAHPAVAKHIAETYLESWAEEFERTIFMVETPDFAWSKFRLDGQGPLAQVEHRVGLLGNRESAPVVHRASCPS
jgi:ribonuclease G